MIWVFAPEAILASLTLALLCLTLVKNQDASRILDPLMILSSAMLCFAVLGTLGQLPTELFYASYQVNLLTQGFKFMLAAGLFFTVIFLREAPQIPPQRRVEACLFLSASALGMMMITSAADILTLYVALELASYPLYLLVALREDRRAAEAGVKYLIFGAAASGIFLWGLSFLAGLSQSTSLPDIAQKTPLLLKEPLFAVGLLFTTVSFLFKLSAFPLHFWAPDAYESALTPFVNFIATASKSAAVAILVRFFLWMGLTGSLTAVLGLLAFFSMTLGNTVALVQNDFKRLLAYSSIAQAGYILVGLLAGTFEGYGSVFFYAFAYVLMNTGAFLAAVFVAKAIQNDNPQIAHFDGLAERSPLLALILLLSLLSLAGIPPLVGFTGKWILFTAAMEKGHWFLVLWGVLNSVVSLFYYLTIVRHAYLEKPKDPSPILLNPGIKMLCLFLFCTLVFLGVFPNFLIELAQNAVAGGTLPL